MDRTKALSFRQIYFRRRFVILLFLLLALILITPLVEGFVKLHIIWNIFLTGIFVSAVYAVSEQKRRAYMASLLALPMLCLLYTSDAADDSVLV